MFKEKLKTMFLMEMYGKALKAPRMSTLSSSSSSPHLFDDIETLLMKHLWSSLLD